MPKRIDNKRGKHAGSRCKRVRYGYHRQIKIEKLKELRAALEGRVWTTDKDKEMEREYRLSMAKSMLRSILPKRLFRRPQNR